MSMPSSSDAVATIAFSSPALELLLGPQPRFARQAAVMAGHVSLAELLFQIVATRSARRRVLTNTSVLRCSRISSLSRA